MRLSGGSLSIHKIGIRVGHRQRAQRPGRIEVGRVRTADARPLGHLLHHTIPGDNEVSDDEASGLGELIEGRADA
eukprot:scaffold189005_cov30-Tisochrysis_lutea.AAC.1